MSWLYSCKSNETIVTLAYVEESYVLCGVLK